MKDRPETQSTERVQVLNRNAKPHWVDVPKGYTVKREGLAERGDKFWMWHNASWCAVKDSHSFLFINVQHLQCVITPEVKDVSDQ